MQRSDHVLRTCNRNICAIDVIQDVFQFSTKKEAAKKLTKYKALKKNVALKSLKYEAFISKGGRIACLAAISSWCDLMCLLQSCRDKHLIVNFMERNAVLLRSTLGDAPVVGEHVLERTHGFGASSLHLLRSCQAIALHESAMQNEVHLLPLTESLFLDDLIDDLGQAFNHKYNIERSKYKTEDCLNVRYIRLACQARGKPSSKVKKRRAKDSIKCDCKSVCTLKGKVDEDTGRILVSDLPLLYFCHSHDCTSPQSGIFRPLHPSLEMFILQHKCMTLQMGDLQRLCCEKGSSLATNGKEEIRLGPDARFKPTINQIKNVLKRDALKTWRRGNDQTNLRAKGLGMAKDEDTFVVFRESRERQHAIHGKLGFFSPSHDGPKSIWVYGGLRKGTVPHVSSTVLPYERPLASSHTKGRQRFLFLWMTRHGKYMLEKYGCWVGFDSTYRLNMYGFPLSILVVKTNMGNAFPVCFYLSDLEDTSTHEEAIALVKWICPNWRPETVLSDCAMELVHAVESNFPLATCIWCHFHVEQALLRHVKKKYVNVGKEVERQKLMKFMHALLYAKTKVAFENVELEFKQYLKHFGFEATERYYHQYLKKHEMRWATYARNKKRCWGHVKSINTNNLNESFNGKLKQQFGLKRNKLVTSLVMKLMNVAKMFWTDYVHANTMQSNPYRTLYIEGNIIPTRDLCVVRRPDIVVRALATNQKKGQTNNYTITPIDSSLGQSWLVSGSRFVQYTVKNDRNCWTCTCVASSRARIPCHHIFATLQHTKMDFCSVELLGPHFCIDEQCVDCPDGRTLGDAVTSCVDTYGVSCPQDMGEEPTYALSISSQSPLNDDDESRQAVMDQLRALRSNFFQVANPNPTSLALYKGVLKVVEEYAMTAAPHTQSSTSHAQTEILATSKRLYDFCMEGASNDQVTRLQQCLPLVAALREVTQGSVPTLGTPKVVKKRKRQQVRESPLLSMEKFVKTHQQTYAVNQKNKVVRTLSQSLNDIPLNQTCENRIHS